MPRALTMEEKIQKVEAKQEQVRTTTQRGSRSRRNSFNGTEGKLRVEHGIEGYHLHIFNDTPGRIDQALAGDYEFVSPDEVGGVAVNTVSRNTDIGDKVRFLVGTDESGQALYAYLMKIRNEFYEEDQAVIQARVDRTDDAIRQGKPTSDSVSSEGFYVPREGISMKRK